MIWLTWRQFRAQAMVVYGALLVLVIILTATGFQLAHLYSADGPRMIGQISEAEQTVYYVGFLVVLLVPAVIGMFWGAPLIARELEADTHRLVWNQTVTRTHWLTIKLAVTGLATMAAAALVSLLLTWWCGPIDEAVDSGGGVGGPLGVPRIGPLLFDSRGVAPIGYAAFAFVLGVTFGVLIRRTLPAMAATVAAFIVVQVVMPLWVRPHLATPDQVTIPITAHGLMNVSGSSITMNIDKPGAWLLSERTLNAAGQPVAAPSSFLNCIQSTDPAQLPRCVDGLTRLHYQQLATYQPAGNFWALQWAETGIFLALAAALAGFSAWWIRRRLS